MLLSILEEAAKPYNSCHVAVEPPLAKRPHPAVQAKLASTALDAGVL